MPSTIRDVFAGAGLEPEGCVRWNQRVPCRDTGVYVVALTDNVNSLAEALPAAPLRRAAFAELLRVREELRLDGERPSAAALERRLAAFWLPDEVVLYVGLSSRPLVTRVREYYRTPLGANKKHAGGWWLKTLTILNLLWVHYATTTGYDDAEDEMLRAFTRGVSSSSREALHGSDRVMPFANLKDADDLIKDHGIERATGPMPPVSASTAGPRKSPGRSDDATAAKRPPAPVEKLEALGVSGILWQLARDGQIIDVRCEMPQCYCFRGRSYFEPRSARSDWEPTADHYPRLRAHGGHLTPDNVRLAHRLCNRRDYTWRMKINAMLGKRMSLEEIAEKLNVEKVPTVHGTNRWTAASVRKAFVS